MNTISESVKTIHDDSAGFLNYVFNFDHENKSRMINMTQYTLLTVIPVLLILRGIKHVIPEEDESKGSFEILAESMAQIILIVLSIWFTNKIINYIPTYSGEEYPKFNEISFIIPFILIMATMQTKLGAKFNILIDRFIVLVIGKKEEKITQNTSQQQNGQNVVRVTQPISGQHQPSQADYLDKSQLLPSNPQMSAMPQMQQPPQQIQPQNDFNNMYAQSNEPMAANDGGGWGSTW